jgi:hypothetical protein
MGEGMVPVMAMVMAIATTMAILIAMVILMDIPINIPIDTRPLLIGEIIITNQGIDPVISDEIEREGKASDSWRLSPYSIRSPAK